MRKQTVLVSLMLTAVVWASSANPVGAQTREEAVRRVEAAARHQLEVDLTSSDHTDRWAALRAISSLKAPWLAEIVLPLCQAPDLGERVIALKVVANTNPRLGKGEFVDALNSHERAIRLRGLLGLAALGDWDTASDVVKILEDDPDPDLRAMAAKTLGAIGDERAAFALHDAIEDPVPAVGEQAVLALVAMDDPEVGEVLEGILDDDEGPGVVPLLRMMALVPDPDLIEILTPYLENGNAEIRAYATAAILSVLELTGQSSP